MEHPPMSTRVQISSPMGGDTRSPCRRSKPLKLIHIVGRGPGLLGRAGGSLKWCMPAETILSALALYHFLFSCVHIS